eukprot:252234_1
MSLYVIGRNGYGEFGFGHKHKISQITKHHILKDIATVKCASKHIMYLDKDKHYWFSGNICFGRPTTHLTKFQYFTANNIKIQKIFTSITGLCMFFISSKNKLYGIGDNFYHQLGIGDDKNRNIPCPIDTFTDSNSANIITDIKTAWDYSIALQSVNINKIVICWFNMQLIPNDVCDLIQSFYGHNHVFSTSFSNHGGNGRSAIIINKKRKNKWGKIETFENKNIIKIQCGFEHSLFLESNGTVWCCGLNDQGQLGLSHSNNKRVATSITYFIENKITIKDISCGYHHNMAVSYEGKIYSWGLNRDGQCGFKYESQILTPKLIDTFSDCCVKKFLCGGFHSYVCTDNNKHYLFGRNKYNQCVCSEYDKIMEPFLINDIIEEQCNGKMIQNVYMAQSITIFVLHDKKK